MALSLQKNDTRAKTLIIIFSVVVFALVTVLGKYNLAGQIDFPFDVHFFALLNAAINAAVSVLLVIGLVFIKQKKMPQHRQAMLTAMVLSVLFLLSYVCHHLFAGEAIYGDIDGQHGLSAAERAAAGSMRTVYLLLLITHIPLAGLVLPFILYTAYKALISEFGIHKKISKIIWPLWLYVAVTGVIIYVMIKPYYH